MLTVGLDHRCCSSPVYPETVLALGRLIVASGLGSAEACSTTVSGCHSLFAVAAGTGDVLMCRLRQGGANTAQGAARFDLSSVGQHRRMAGFNLLAAIVIYWNTVHLSEAV